LFVDSDATRMKWPWADRNGRFSPLKAGVFAALFAPGIWLVQQVQTGAFGAIPLAGMTYWSGVWATAVLLLTLVVTPAGTILRFGRLIVVRRMIGVAALAYTVAHLFIYFALRLWNFPSIAGEMVTRPTLVIATLSTLGLAALGATSIDAAIRIMGDGWQRLHNTVYFFTALALIHYLLSPGIFSEQYLLSGMFFWLMAWRFLNSKGLGTNAPVLAVLAVATCFFTALLEAGWIWIYQGFEPIGTLWQNFSLDLGLSAAWRNLAAGLAIAAAALFRRSARSRG
jgi:methionine sulfoxide reductase heme-binding subunit